MPHYILSKCCHSEVCEKWKPASLLMINDCYCSRRVVANQETAASLLMINDCYCSRRVVGKETSFTADDK